MFLRRVAVAFPPSSRRLFISNSSSHDFSITIAELNKEMEFVFGEPPPTSLAGASDSQFLARDSEVMPPGRSEAVSGLTNIGGKGEAQMVDVTPKEISKRVAIASGKVILGRKAFDWVSANQVAKGDVLSVAKIAGITGAKQTSNLIPLCHNIKFTHVRLTKAKFRPIRSHIMNP